MQLRAFEDLIFCFAVGLMWWDICVVVGVILRSSVVD